MSSCDEKPKGKRRLEESVQGGLGLGEQREKAGCRVDNESRAGNSRIGWGLEASGAQSRKKSRPRSQISEALTLPRASRKGGKKGK